MANSATALTPLLAQIKGSGHAILTPVVVSMDTAASDLTVYTPAADAYAAIVGWQHAEATAFVLDIKSAATTILTLDFGASNSKNNALGEGIVLSTRKGEALKFNLTGVLTVSILLYIAECKQIFIRL